LVVNIKGSADITTIVVDKLKELSEDFELFFRYHFDIKTNQSLTPRFDGTKMSFPKKTKILVTDMDFKSKLRYYLEDLGDYNNPKADYLKCQIRSLIEDLV